MKSNEHKPILLNEVIEGLDIKSDGVYLDLTLGRAGHSKEILKRLSLNGLLIGIDQDEEAISYSRVELSKISNRYKIVKSNFSNIKNILSDLNISTLDGALFDLGVSSPQFDEDYRGFSYRFNNKLDMRMDLSSSLTAYDVVNTYSFKELLRVFKEYGEDKYSYNIAKNIVKERDIKPIVTTFDLVDIIKRSKPLKELNKVGHPAKQIFQAIRIEVNNELNVLKKALEDVINSLNINGRVCVITFHSLEDRIVKNLFKKYSVVEGNRINDFRKAKDIEEANFIEVNKKVIVPSEEEIINNPRSKSAKLRILKRVR
ncbi:MAG: 16S rRNA (cytosine(1402)-N(4))-methyltransferase RsmH [Bacilli bacterium]|nr:16S rRNA (cytosine(1402)-N(4))-methyltransferase RsmH [Mollicutes bacterium]MDD6468306.1 16S rRNA (cytosine(1402)-N(4))-methyltransferase RsmH [Bacilli bacterium]MDY2724988.1 16S rRNA (cytosine(1402)-N(4))-methyltransferase RsmH [Candidatus Onthovivens sp.]MCI7039673.1 16S rRNA (cytosine(1402)-N(4))-methyltransferase RsmH [Mollicutes bacterium]MCI7225420.1 16S rRNA (cytosine(1402)-N(4))-methyltransferase RsmH [Mollicutes bacterium]